jgi:hypothetical protein
MGGEEHAGITCSILRRALTSRVLARSEWSFWITFSTSREVAAPAIDDGIAARVWERRRRRMRTGGTGGGGGEEEMGGDGDRGGEGEKGKEGFWLGLGGKEKRNCQNKAKAKNTAACGREPSLSAENFKMETLFEAKMV